MAGKQPHTPVEPAGKSRDGVRRDAPHVADVRPMFDPTYKFFPESVPHQPDPEPAAAAKREAPGKPAEPASRSRTHPGVWLVLLLMLAVAPFAYFYPDRIAPASLEGAAAPDIAPNPASTKGTIAPAPAAESAGPAPTAPAASAPAPELASKPASAMAAPAPPAVREPAPPRATVAVGKAAAPVGKSAAPVGKAAAPVDRAERAPATAPSGGLPRVTHTKGGGVAAPPVEAGPQPAATERPEAPAPEPRRPPACTEAAAALGLCTANRKEGS